MAALRIIVLIGVLAAFVLFSEVTSNPALDIIEAYDHIGVCVRNCAQCRKMLGQYFDGQLCADSCVKFRGKVIPDCEDIGSIAPFLNHLE